MELQVLIETAFNMSREQFWMRKNDRITDNAALRKFYRYLERRLKGEPMAYILGKREFYGEMFFVNKNVLIPRPETEILVEKAIELINALPGKEPKILDIGAGSGNISISLAMHTQARITAVDTSREALYVCRKNLKLHGLTERVQAVRADLFPPPHHGEYFDIIVSNPPYVPDAEWQILDASVRDYEPRAALMGGPDGSNVIRRIVERAWFHLKPGGKLLLEIGYNLHKPVKKILERSGFSSFQFVKDYNGIYRVAVAGTARRSDSRVKTGS